MRNVSAVACLLAALALGSCGGEDAVSPEDTGVPRVRYSPDPGSVMLVIGDSLELSVEVSPGQPYGVEYSLDDSVVTDAKVLKVFGEQVGLREYTAVVNVGEYWYDDSWTVRTVIEAELPTPAPGSPAAEPGSVPGSILVAWDRPPDWKIETVLAGFEIAWSDQPFTRDEFALQDTIRVADSPFNTRQVKELTGLPESQNWYLRVRSVDVLERFSWPTDPVSSESTGSFELSGTVWQLDGAGLPVPVPSAVVEAGPSLQTTGTDGRFLLPGLPDHQPISLFAEEGSGLYTLPVLASPIDPLDRALDILLVQRSMVAVRHLGSVTEISKREFLIKSTGHASLVPPHDFRPWPSYPVKIWVWEYTGVNNVSYGDAFRFAAEKWNREIPDDGLEFQGDDRMVEIVSVPDSLFDPTGDPDLIGAYVRFYAGGGGTPNLGVVDMMRPAGCDISLCDPELARITLRRSFPSQALANRVVSHEVGHVLGLVHTVSETNVMHISSDLAQGIPTPEEIYVARYIRYAGDMMADWLLPD